MTQPVFRFAPSPNGRLHLGHAYSAWLNAELAKQMNGRFLLRIEDIDITRCSDELTQACLDDLSWLGLSWETPVRIQSRHFADYIAVHEQLKERGLTYPCFCSRKEVAEASEGSDPDGAPLYGGTCRMLLDEEVQDRIAAGEPYAWRIKMDEAQAAVGAPLSYVRFDAEGKEECVAVLPERWGDAVLVRKEISTSYHLSVVVDDALQGVTHIVRGKDLEAATDLHVLLQALLELPTPCYLHHDLIPDEGGDKLAKSKGSESLEDLRARGVSAAEILAGFVK